MHWTSKSYHILPVVLIQISKCLGKTFQPNGHGVDAKDLAEKMQRLSTEVSTSANVRYLFSSCVSPVPFKTLCYFQRSGEAAEARTSGSVSPADFFSQTPKENSNFQIPVSCGKISPLKIYCYLIFTCDFMIALIISFCFLRHRWFDKSGAVGW